MIEKHNIKLDAFVLDDGWDVYESDWQVKKGDEPNGFKPLADELKKTNTTLGVWFATTGGYSFRMRRLNWMKEHGYETVGKTRDNMMLCLAGKNYSELFKNASPTLSRMTVSAILNGMASNFPVVNRGMDIPLIYILAGL